MLKFTLQTINGYPVTEYCGLVTAAATCTINEVSGGIADWFTKFGGRSKAYTKLVDTATSTALQTLDDKAAELGATAVLGIQLSIASVVLNGEDAVQIIASGTAVKL